MASWMDRFTRETRATDSTVQMLTGAEPKSLEHSFDVFSNAGYKGNSAVFALIMTRAVTLKGVRFAYQSNERPYTLERGPKLLEKPWKGGSTAQIVARMEVDGSLAGNSFWTIRDSELMWLRPDWVERIEQDGVLRGYIYYEGGKYQGTSGVLLEPAEVAHYKPIPDPQVQNWGMSWLVPAAEEADADSLMTRHKRRFFDNAATPAMAVVSERNLNKEQRTLLREQFQARHEGVENAYKTVFLEGGADLKVVGVDLRQMSFSAVQGAGETRLAAAAGVPPIVVGFAEGLQAATYSNYGQAVRKYADGFLRPTWEDMAEALAPIMPKRSGKRLWFDDRNVALLQQDAADGAAIVKEQALTIEALIRSGFDPETVTEAVITGSFENLEHSGLVSVQLLPPGSDGDQVASVKADPKSRLAETLKVLMATNDA